MCAVSEYHPPKTMKGILFKFPNVVCCERRRGEFIDAAAVHQITLKLPLIAIAVLLQCIDAPTVSLVLLELSHVYHGISLLLLSISRDGWVKRLVVPLNNLLQLSIATVKLLRYLPSLCLGNITASFSILAYFLNNLLVCAIRALLK